jgi:glycosyltransferase involved in cell wall biosynthesis
MFIWYAKFLGIKVVYTVHNVLPHDTGTRYKQSFSSFYHEVDALICHTVEAKNRLVEEFHVPSNKISVIPHGPLFLPAPKMSKAEAKRAIGYSPNVPLVLFFGRIEPYKGLEFLLRSWNTVSQRVDGAHLLLAGRAYPDEKASLKHQVKHLKVPESVETRFYYLPEEELSLVTKGADVLVYPYRSITQSGAVLTGLAAGKAIVATNVGGIPEVVKDGQTGMLVDYGDHVALARTLVQLLEDAEIRKNLEAGAREMIEEEYSWDTIARKTMVCYQSIINES